MIKISYLSEMSYDISSEEKHQAQQLLIYVDQTLKLLKDSKDYLDTIKVPFENNPETKSEEIMSQRFYLRDFRDKSVQKFNDFKVSCFHCVDYINKFSSDPQILKISKAFVSTVDDLEKSVNKFVDLFLNLESDTFVKDIIDIVTLIQMKCDDVKDMLDERLKGYVASNILMENWVDRVRKDFNFAVNNKKPKMLEIIRQLTEEKNVH